MHVTRARTSKLQIILEILELILIDYVVEDIKSQASIDEPKASCRKSFNRITLENFHAERSWFYKYVPGEQAKSSFMMNKSCIPQIFRPTLAKDVDVSLIDAPSVVKMK